jgi:hypothetical protein
MWVWHTETTSMQCLSPSSALEVVQQDGHCWVVCQGELEALRGSGAEGETLGELLGRVDRWLEVHQLAASGIMGFESSAQLNCPVVWTTHHPVEPDQLHGGHLLVALQVGEAIEVLRDPLSVPPAIQPPSRNRLLVDDALVDRIAQIVSQGLEIRRQLQDDHLVIAAALPVMVRASLLNAWLDGLKTRFTRGFFMDSDRWELASCTPERFMAMHDGRLEVQLLAGTFREGMMLLEKQRLVGEHQAARDELLSLVKQVCQQEDGDCQQLDLVVDCDIVGFGAIKHFRSMFTTQYRNRASMLRRLAALTPSPATGSQHAHVQAAIQAFEGKPRGYYGGCFFLRTPGTMETLISIRSIFRTEGQDVAELIAGAGFTAGSTVEGESAEIIAKATNCARLLGCEVRKIATHTLEKALVSSP